MYKNKNLEKKKTRMVDGVKVQTVATEISHFNTFAAEAGTTGYMGGDSKKGGRAFIKIIDMGNSDVYVERNADGKGFTMRVGGDSELDTLIDSLDFIVSTLKKQKNEKIKERQELRKKILEDKKENKNTNTEHHNDYFATQKQIDFINSLLGKYGLVLDNASLTKQEAKELIEIFKNDNIKEIDIPDKYKSMLKKA